MNSGLFGITKQLMLSLKEWIGLQKTPTKPSSSPSDTASKKSDTSSRPSPLFSDIEIGSSSEKKQDIPVRTTIYREKSENLDQNNLSGIDNSAHSRLIADMLRYADRTEEEAQLVPFKGTREYSRMTALQSAWYFYWRTEIRSGRYPDTAPECILLHTYELLNGVGWQSVSEGLDRLIGLWSSYRDRFPQFDQYFFSWTLDFAQQHQLDHAPDELFPIPLPIPDTTKNLLIDRHREDKPLKLSFPLILLLSPYPLKDSKFYKDGNQKLIEEAVPRAIALADAAMLKKSGKGILATYGPKRSRKQTCCIYKYAVHPKANQRMDVQVRDYVSCYELRTYLNDLIRHIENILRSICKYRGRLRTDFADSETADLIETFLRKEYSADKKTPAETKPVIKLDFDSIAELRTQSDAVRDALEVAEPTDESAQSPLPSLASDPEETLMPEADVKDQRYFSVDMLSESMHHLLDMLSNLHEEALWSILTSDDPMSQLNRIAESAMTMPEILIDDINDAAAQVLDDILIDAFGDEPSVLDQYRAELKSAAINGG